MHNYKKEKLLKDLETLDKDIEIGDTKRTIEFGKMNKLEVDFKNKDLIETVIFKIEQVGYSNKLVCLCENGSLSDKVFDIEAKDDIRKLADYRATKFATLTTTQTPLVFDGKMFKRQLLEFLDGAIETAENAKGLKHDEGDTDGFILRLKEIENELSFKTFNSGNYYACLEGIGEDLDYKQFELDYGDEFGWVYDKELLTYFVVLQKALGWKYEN